MMRKLMVAAFMAGLAVTAAAGTVYKWIDVQGQVHYTDRPPHAADAKLIAVYEEKSGETETTGEAGNGDASPPGDQGPPPAGDEVPPASKEQLAAVNADVAKARAERCKSATERYTTYVNSRRLYRPTPDGKRQYLTDAELSQARVNAKREMDESCR